MKEPHGLPSITIYGNLPARSDVVKQFREYAKSKELPRDDLNLFLAWLCNNDYIQPYKIVPKGVRE